MTEGADMTNRRFTYEPNIKSEEVPAGEYTCPATPVFCDRRPGNQLCSKIYSHAGECK